MEQWRDVPGYEGLYQISIDTKEGRCRSLNYWKTKQVKELSNRPKKEEIIAVTVYGGRYLKTVYIHLNKLRIGLPLHFLNLLKMNGLKGLLLTIRTQTPSITIRPTYAG